MMQPPADGQADSDQHPDWPPTDSDGQIIGDVPWKFFESPRGPRRGG